MPRSRDLVRFTRAERWVHTATAALMGICIVTALILYVGPIAVAVGRRATVEQIHVIAGLALPVPLILGYLSRSVREDVRRLSRFIPGDSAWLRSRNRRTAGLPVDKFNAGQKLNASFTTGAILVMWLTGIVMRFANSFSVTWRTGATFVHDWLFYAILVVVIGHIYMASKDREARRGMRHGVVDEDWARREHPAWAETAPQA